MKTSKVALMMAAIAAMALSSCSQKKSDSCSQDNPANVESVKSDLQLHGNALTYEAVFEAIKAMPNMKGVSDTGVSGQNDFAALGVTDTQIIVWRGETMVDNETEVYGNEVYKLMGELPVSEMVQCRIDQSTGTLFAIFARTISKGSNRILILSDSGEAGVTGAMIGYIDDAHLDALRQAILMPNEVGGTSLYLRALNF